MTLSELYSKADFKNKYGMIFNGDCMNLLSNISSREREREFNRTFVSLYDVDCRDDKKRRRQNQWEAYLRENNNQTEIEPIDFFYPNATSRSAGSMNGLIDGKETYRRILICKKVGV